MSLSLETLKQDFSTEKIRRIDKSDMLSLLLDFPEQCTRAQGLAVQAGPLPQKKSYKQVVFTGVGGSAIGADLVKSYLYFECKVPSYVYRDGELPSYIGGDTLVFAISYSGDTEETLRAYMQARERGAHTIVISSGGRLGELARKNKDTLIRIPEGLIPRCSLGYLSIPPLCILSQLGLIEDPAASIKEMIATLKVMRDDSLGPALEVDANQAKAIARNLLNRFPVVYSAYAHFEAVSLRMRNQLNENAKVLASSHLFPEMGHNEIMGWQNHEKLSQDFAVVMFRDRLMHETMQKRMDIASQIIRQEGVPVFEIWSRGNGLLSRIFSLVYTGDFISYYLAICYGIDPTPIDRVVYFKHRLLESR